MKHQKGRVTGIGGIFFKAKDPGQLAAWHRDHLGIPVQNECADFPWRDKEDPNQIGRTVWSVFPVDTDYFGSSQAPFMINYRVSNLEEMLAELKAAGVAVEKVENSEYGRFAWITDPEGNRVELWEPRSE
jgi:catechol 2,3-dioxygenase-like lactoylglutathione lyase family enzyme